MQNKKQSAERSLPREPGMNPRVNELKIKQRAVGGKTQNSTGQRTPGDKSIKAAAYSQTGELEIYSSRGPRTDRNILSPV